MPRPTRALAAALVAALALTGLTLTLGSAQGAPPRGLRAVALTADGELVAFRTGRAAQADDPVRVRGLVPDTRLIGIDRRVQDGRLYGVGNLGGVYRVTLDGRATRVDTLDTLPLGAAFAVDFNPAADRLRIVSASGQNLRHDLTEAQTPTVTDTPLTYAPEPARARGVTAGAYTNNDLVAETGTILFDLDTALDQLVVQSPANAGLLSVVGSLGVDAVGDAGLDIVSTTGKDGATRTNRAFAVLQVDGRTRLYGVSLLTGRTTRLGTFPAGERLVDLAVLPRS